MKIDYSCIGARIKTVRKQKRITQEQMAEKLSVSVGYVSQLERGITKINLEMLASIAAILDHDICFFIDGTSAGQKEFFYRELSDKIERMTPAQRKLLSSIAADILASDL